MTNTQKPRFTGTLLPHQIESVEWCLNKESQGCLLADDMGLGKTVTACHVMTSRPLKTLLVLPKAIIEQWCMELMKHTTYEYTDIIIHRGSDRFDDIYKEDLEKRSIVITTYDTIFADSKKKKNLEFMNLVKPQRLICDESHRLKNPKSQCFKIFKNFIVDRCSHILFMTGTPMTNSFVNIISYMKLFKNEKYRDAFSNKTFYSFKVKMVQEFGKEHVLYRRKEDYISLPNKKEEEVRCVIEDESRMKGVYDKFLKFCLNPYLTSEALEHIFVKILRLRQLINSEILIGKAQKDNFDMNKLDPETRLFKILKKVNEIESGDQIIIFSQWKKWLDILGQYLEKNGEKVSFYNGSLKQNERNDAIHTFKVGKTRIMLMTVQSGGVGLNLTNANHVFMCEKLYNPADEEQAICRSYRIGQKKEVSIYKMYTEHTIDDWMGKISESKIYQERQVFVEKNSVDDIISGLKDIEKEKTEMFCQYVSFGGDEQKK